MNDVLRQLGPHGRLVVGAVAALLGVLAWGLALHLAIAARFDVALGWLVLEGLMVTGAAVGAFVAASTALAMPGPEAALELDDDTIHPLPARPRWADAAASWSTSTRSTLRDLSMAVDRQFERWHLARDEREVAILLLRGMTVDEVAEALGTQRAEVLAHAQAVYDKAGFDGRRDLLTFFLDGLVLPSDGGVDDLDVPITGVG